MRKGGGDVESADEWSLSHLISNASAMKSTTKSHKAMTCTAHTPLALVLLLYPIASQKLSEAAYTSVFVFWLLSVDRKEEAKMEPSSHHAPSRSVRKKIRQPVDNNSNNREEEGRINKNKK